ncbi:hypothetical protein N7528_006843 [Penicillium herquei]|nr:hypothetical protein N7528_006843 [Penicillium herquei]
MPSIMIGVHYAHGKIQLKSCATTLNAYPVCYDSSKFRSGIKAVSASCRHCRSCSRYVLGEIDEEL